MLNSSLSQGGTQTSAYLELFRGKRALITGGLGFIGSNLARRLVDLGADVLVIDSLIPAYGGNLFNITGLEDRIRINIADVRDRSSMDYLVQRQDYLFNLAGQVSHVDSMSDPFTDLEINCRSQLSILESCRHNNPDVKVVFASTRQIYGVADYLPADERHLLHPTDVNGINKMAGEWYHIVYNNVYDIRAASLRLTNTFGPRMRVCDARQTFLGLWLRIVLEDGELCIYGDGRQVRDFNYVDDVVDALLRVAGDEQANGQVYNLGGDEPISLLHLAQLLVHLAGRGSYRLVPWPENRKRIDIGDYYGDYRKIESALGWCPRVSLEEGLRRSLAYYDRYREHYWHDNPVSAGAETPVSGTVGPGSGRRVDREEAQDPC
jgi:UDP-glucose 4-epimerase